MERFWELRQWGARLAKGTALAVALAAGFTAQADEVVLENGSRLVGQVTGVADGKLTLKTDFAGEMVIDTAKISGIATEQPITVETDKGTRLIGKLNYTKDAGQSIISEDAGKVDVPLKSMTAAWEKGADSPEVAKAKSELAKAQTRWELRILAGFNGKTGNSEQVAFNGGINALRKTEKERLSLYANGRFARNNHERSANEILGGAKLEVDISPEWYVFGEGEMEFDEFENLDLRSTVSAGIGHFWIREKDHELKTHAGLGYLHESFDDGTSEDEGIAVLGVSYMKEINEWLKFTHETTYHPSFEGLDDFRLVSETAGELPLSSERDWKMRIGMRNDYNSQPKPDVRRLDTFYFVNLVWDYK